MKHFYAEAAEHNLVLLTEVADQKLICLKKLEVARTKCKK
jgi:hypothetical protein